LPCGFSDVTLFFSGHGLLSLRVCAFPTMGLAVPSLPCEVVPAYDATGQKSPFWRSFLTICGNYPIQGRLVRLDRGPSPTWSWSLWPGCSPGRQDFAPFQPELLRNENRSGHPSSSTLFTEFFSQDVLSLLFLLFFFLEDFFHTQLVGASSFRTWYVLPSSFFPLPAPFLMVSPAVPPAVTVRS